MPGTRRAFLLSLRVAIVATAPWVVPFVGRAAAQSATVNLSVDRTTVAVGETFRLEIRVDVEGGGVEQMTVPDLSAFEVVDVRRSQPFAFSFGVGGAPAVVRQSLVHRYLLRALREGRHVLGPAAVTVAGRVYRSSSLTLTVVASTGAVPGTSAPQPVPPPATSAEEPFDEQAFVRTVVDRPRVYVGQQVTATVQLYVRGGLRAPPEVRPEPTTQGFWLHDLLGPNTALQPSRQRVRGTMFDVYVLRRWALFPLQPGELVVGPAGVRLSVGNGLFDLFGTVPLERHSAPVTVEAMPLPEEGRPDGPVLVGRAEMTFEADRTVVATGDAVTLTAVLRASGNLRSVELRLDPVDGLRVLAPEVRDEIEAPGGIVGGVRTARWIAVAEREGRFRVPAPRLVAFDPERAAYSVVQAPEVVLEAAGRSPVVAGSTDADPGAPGALRFGPIRTSSALRRTRPAVFERPWYAWALAAPALGYGLLVALQALVRVLRARLARTGPPNPMPVARRSLRLAAARLRQADARGCFAALETAVRAVLEARLAEPIGGLTRAELGRLLRDRGLGDEPTRAVLAWLETVERARFAPGQAAEPKEAMREARRLVDRLARWTPAGGERA
ncbi:MAG: BatD family protein [Myxococcota bacterium]|nr:BatD family protein [Myxococcota bacterium]